MSTPRPGDSVTLHYRLTCCGEEVVSTFDAEPETFMLGAGELEARFESLLLNVEAGAHVIFELEPGEGFGMRDESLVHTLPRSDFPPDMVLEVDHGMQFDLPNGESMMGTLLDVGADQVRIDFNHPLAGLPVSFEVHLLDIAAS